MASSTTALKNLLIGTPVYIQATFRTAAGVLADPIAVQFVVRKPDGTESTYTNPQITRVSVGVWHLQVPTDQAGQWIVNTAGAGNDVDVNDEATFVVRAKRT